MQRAAGYDKAGCAKGVVAVVVDRRLAYGAVGDGRK